ncbi:MAG TPA: T9SS type A sorting domain-containing protein [Leadbetterella sp.]|nr:T9SS type A sorting domain-containing protein [Leadbetterella sp.]
MRNIVLFITLIISGFGVFAQGLVAPSLVELPSSITTNSFLVLVNDTNPGEMKIEIELSGPGLLRSTLVDPNTSFNFNNTSLAPNTTYTVRARAINCAAVLGCPLPDIGPWSNIITSKTLVAIPAAPILKLDNNCARFVSISWEVTERASEITNFQVLRSFAGAGYQLVGNFPNFQRNLFDLGVQPGVATTYVVIAENSTGQRQSNQVSVNVKAFVPPTPPINVQSSTVNKSDTQLNITWENPEQDYSCGTNIRSSYYVMIKREGETEFKLYNIIYPTASNVIISGLKPNERVEYSIFSLSDRGLFSEHRKGVDNTYGPASKPTNFIGVAFKDAVNNSSIGLSWDHAPKDEDYFVIEVSKDGTNFQTLGKIKDGDNKFKHEPIEEGVGYTYRIKAGNYLFGESDYVLTQPITYAYSAAPNAPYGLSGTVAATKVDLKWYDDSNKEESYILERSIDNNTTFAELKKLDRNAVAYSDNTVTAGKKYYYRIKGINPVGSSSYSNIFEAKTPGGSGFVSNTEFSIFPNPTLDFLSIKLPSEIDNSSVTVSLLDQNNIEVFKKNFETKTIKVNLSNLDSGVYNMIIKTSNETLSRKIVKY